MCNKNKTQLVLISSNVKNEI